MQRTRPGLVAWARTLDRAVIIGVLAAMALAAGTASYLAFLNSPYQTDESSHVGYSLSLRDGHLPDIDTDVPTARGGEELEAAVGRPWPFAVPEIHVGQNPPFAYAAAVPLTEITSALDIRAGPLLGVRMLNVLGAVGAVAATALLGWELGGRDPLVGVTAAGMLAGLVSLSFIVSIANLDGVALCATTLVAWALARYARTRSDGDALLLGVCLAGAAMVRPMALAIALTAGIAAVVLSVRARGWRRGLAHTVRIAGPAVVVAGWFYILNVVRYGDPTGSSAVLEKYGYQGTRTFWDILWGPEPFIQTMPYLLTDVYGVQPWWTGTGARQYLVAALSVGVVLGAIFVARRDRRRGTSGGSGGSRPLSVASWTSVAILAVVPVLLTARHMNNGGAGHARYVLPAVPIVLAALSLLAVRLNRWLPVLFVLVASAAHLLRIDDAGRVRVPEPSITARVLRGATVGQPYRALALGVAVVGAVALVASVAQLAHRRRTPSTAVDASTG